MTNTIADYIIEHTNDYRPEIAIITGSGLGSLVDLVDEKYRIKYTDIKGMPISTIQGHEGCFILGNIGNKKAICMLGRVHLYEGYGADDIFNIMEALKLIGVNTVIITNSAGSLDVTMPPSSIMMITDHINMSGQNSLTGKKDAFIDCGNLYDIDDRVLLHRMAKEDNINLFEGTYVMVAGPSFETPAEIRMFKNMGARAVGMSTVQEVLACAYLGIKILAFSLITNYGTAMTPGKNSHERTLKNAQASIQGLHMLLSKYIKNM